MRHAVWVGGRGWSIESLCTEWLTSSVWGHLQSERIRRHNNTYCKPGQKETEPPKITGSPWSHAQREDISLSHTYIRSPLFIQILIGFHKLILSYTMSATSTDLWFTPTINFLWTIRQTLHVIGLWEETTTETRKTYDCHTKNHHQLLLFTQPPTVWHWPVYLNSIVY